MIEFEIWFNAKREKIVLDDGKIIKGEKFKKQIEAAYNKGEGRPEHGDPDLYVAHELILQYIGEIIKHEYTDGEDEGTIY